MVSIMLDNGGERKCMEKECLPTLIILNTLGSSRMENLMDMEKEFGQQGRNTRVIGVKAGCMAKENYLIQMMSYMLEISKHASQMVTGSENGPMEIYMKGNTNKDISMVEASSYPLNKDGSMKVIGSKVK
jgi:hypothetical protein